MQGIHELRQKAAQYADVMATGLTEKVPLKQVVADLVIPLLEMEATMDDWPLFLSEAKDRSGYTKNYFEEGLEGFGGRSRLQVWKERDQARQGPGGIWLIRREAVPAPKEGYAPPSTDGAGADRKNTAPGAEPEPDPDAFVDELLGTEK